ncbi:peptidase M24, structural domain-containing protein [Hygrophoropsis aurantiaca]|uniref:Peptidase M24, structural domain-containing protein n=1 Tax=Hygrophoropsis aurantiaca TaxID=72124 RepID=A0ACB8AAM1_9AGAM|nr:peptidase M24, structural domain-containing protein [Hygrophoropsis aurantiaca]
MGKHSPDFVDEREIKPTATPDFFVLKVSRFARGLFIAALLIYATYSLAPQSGGVSVKSPPTSSSKPFTDLGTHCAAAQAISPSEFVTRQNNLARVLHEQKAEAYIAEPGANALFFGNISSEAWHLSERPLLLMVSPVLQGNEVSAKVTVLTPVFEETRARLLVIPGVDVTYAAWPEDKDPYAVALRALPNFQGGIIYVDGMIRNFIVDGLQKAAPNVKAVSAPAEVRQLRERKSPAEIEILKCVNEVTLLAIRAVQSHMYIGIRESQVREMMEDALAAAGLTTRFALVLFGENAALPHGEGTDRILGDSDFVLIDTGGALYGYESDVTRTFMLRDSIIPAEHYTYWANVQAAQSLAQATARAGVVTAHVDAQARHLLELQGLSRYFTHRLGHGIGLEGHESPYLVGGSKDVIQTGHTFSNEPGIYIEGKVGVRLEDCFYIAEDGRAVYLTEGVGGQARGPLYP